MAQILNSRAEAVEPSPMMKQYLEVKAEYEGFVLLYRLGDFYECFFEDALLASRELELTLTARDCGSGNRAAMCGVPFHKSDVYVGRLVEKGYKVAICEQVEDPKAASGIVKREVTRVVTPGTVTDNSILDESRNNYLCAITMNDGASVGFFDISTGEVSVTYLSGEKLVEKIENELAYYRPREIIANTDDTTFAILSEFAKDRFDSLVNSDMKPMFRYDRARENVRSVFPKEYEKLERPEMIMAIGALLEYVRQTQKTSVAFVKEINVYSKGEYLDIDMNTRRSLELVENMRNKSKRGTLLGVLDKTKTAMGARLLNASILKPMLDPARIINRQSAIADIIKNKTASEDLDALLSTVLDIERYTAKAVYGNTNAKELKQIEISISSLPAIKAVLSSFECETIRKIARELDTLEDIQSLLYRALQDTPPLTVREGGMIKAGFDKDVDYYRTLKDNAQVIMRSIEEREREETGIKTLRVSNNSVFGYYIEVSKNFSDSVPDRYIRKQTLANCERYITQELKEMEASIFSAEEKLVTLEYEIFQRLRETVSENSERIRKSAALIAEIDLIRSLAQVASENAYVCPDVDLSTDIEIKDGRHPVVEKHIRDSYFVPNDTTLNTSTDRVMIITGPNMAGKSTYMRQVAIITIMAQIGSYVPARYARIGIIDKLFTRVGASDDLASGQSTFMLEMTEVAQILKNATSRSLIIYDEVGRGTSTFDGMAIARAVVEYTNSKKIGAKTLFATHYHELTSLEDELPGVVNYNIAAKKRGDNITFLRKIVRGGTDDSYGIEVAKLAGVPNAVVTRAREILSDIEKNSSQKPTLNKKQTEAVSNQIDLFASIIKTKEDEVSEKIRALDINVMTPIEAMNFIFELKKMLSEE